MCCCNFTTVHHHHQEQTMRSIRQEYDGTINITTTLVNMSFAIKPLNLQGGQCTWCGKYGHKRVSCPLLK